MSAADGSSAAGGAAGGAADGAAGGALHPRSFKLRFASEREPGRSYVSAVKPLGLPATVTDKFYSRTAEGGAAEGGAAEGGAAGAGGEGAALRRIEQLFSQTPRGRLAAPATSAHEYGWWAAEGAAAASLARGDRRRAHPLRDSAWLKAQVLVLAHDARLARR